MKKLKSLMYLLLVLVMSIGMVSTASASALDYAYSFDKTRVKVGEPLTFSVTVGCTHTNAGYDYSIDVVHVDEDGNRTILCHAEDTSVHKAFVFVYSKKTIIPTTPGTIHIEIDMMHYNRYDSDRYLYKVTEKVEVWTDECRHKTTEWIETTPADCTNEGVKSLTCSNCGKVVDTAAIPVNDQHTEGTPTEAVAPTCTEEGEETISCTLCGKLLKTNPIPALGHTTDEGTVTLEPTCTEDGVRSYTCTVCGEEQENEAIPALGHTTDEGSVTLEPTCTETGLRSYTCTVCGEEIEDEEVPALGHTADEGTVTLEPTCTETGLKAHVCTVCGAKLEDSTVEALGHDEGKWIITIPVTENTDGERELHCTRCDELLKTEVIPHAVYYWMNACSVGPHFRDVSDITDKWYMFTPVDLSVDGIQTFDLIGGNMHVIGQVNVLVENGEVTVTYELANKWIKVKSEFLTFFGSLDDVNTVDSIELTGYAFGEPVSIADELGGDTKVLLYIRNGVVYDAMGMGIREFYHRNPEYLQYVEELKLLMD